MVKNEQGVHWTAATDTDMSYEELVAEVHSALEEWRVAQNRFQMVVEEDQIDYAIYAWRAAEKRYQMLLRMAKKKYYHTSIPPVTPDKGGE